MMDRNKLNLLIYSTLFLGQGSMFLFYLFLFLGPFVPLDLGLKTSQALVLDACLSLLFFLQHSLMIRRGFRDRLKKSMAEEFIPAFFALVSSFPLLVLVLFWQETPGELAAATGIFYWLLRGLFLLCIAGFYWGVKSLGYFDPLGVAAIRRLMRNKQAKPVSLKVRGAYRWVRHPLYLFSIIMIWSYPILTRDRLLFNIMWSIWIVIATVLEERDLVHEFGDDYRSYQEKVPMLIPYKFPSE